MIAGGLIRENWEGCYFSYLSDRRDGVGDVFGFHILDPRSGVVDGGVEMMYESSLLSTVSASDI